MSTSPAVSDSVIRRAFDQGGGVLRLRPAWVPRSFCIPGRRIKLDPRDYYALGGARGGIDERWLASTTPAENGPLTAPDEGLSFVVAADGARTVEFLLRDAVQVLGADLLGSRLWKAHGAWTMYSKFFDNQGPLGFHLHHDDAHAALVGKSGKPEAYFFPTQMNDHGGDFPHTFMGFEPGTTREDIRVCLENFTKGDNRITRHSKAYQLIPGTGWFIPPGVLHAPGSLCTYEPQKASDVYAFYQSVIHHRQVVPSELLWKDSPAEKIGDIDYLLELIDWEKSSTPTFKQDYFMAPLPVRPFAESEADGYRDEWICYKSADFSAKQLTILPGREALIRDAAPYGLIVVQGRGQLDAHPLESPTLIRYGELTHDEYFVSEAAATRGVRIANHSRTEPLVMLKHFGPRNPDLSL